MQEEGERKTIAIAVTTGKLTGRVLARVLAAALRKIQQAQKNMQTPQGRQSVNKLMNHGVNTNSIPLDGETRLFDRVARKYNVDYAFHKIGPKKYLLFFKAGQADAITACFAEYTKRVMQKERRLPIREQMQKAADIIARKRPRERIRKREVAHDDR